MTNYELISRLLDEGGYLCEEAANRIADQDTLIQSLQNSLKELQEEWMDGGNGTNGDGGSGQNR